MTAVAEHQTRFPELYFENIGPSMWSFFAADTRSRVGPIYRTKTELLADLTRYAREAWGIS
ncbi:hypothetical protein [Aurantimonas coralicida]|uniref:hypothetical protein n=1 Tax=Aurantimonas coralicida TaxID=182270 RepID=UPI001E565108|nr:hypothetical protein [Aurantimonas coralicida]MCD1645206.1 hypothetical protein [Aurantimonas coralicida]